MAQASSEHTLAELGKKLEEQLEGAASKDSLLKSLKSLSVILSQVDQSAPEATILAMDGVKKVLFRQGLVTHKNRDVRLLVAACASEIMRIEAPNVPYDDATLKTFFGLVVGAFNGLDELKGPSYDKRVHILETFYDVKSCLLMLDLEYDDEDDLILKMFKTFFSRIRSEHPQNVLNMILGIMSMVVNESDDISNALVLEIILNLQTKDSPAAKLAADVVRETSAKIGSAVLKLLTSVHENNIDEDLKDEYQMLKDNYHDVIFGIYCCAPELLSTFLSILKDELVESDVGVRLKTVQLFGKFLTVPEQSIPKEFLELVSELAGRFKDTSQKVRLAAMEAAKDCLLSIDSGADVALLTDGLETRLHDLDDACRTKAVSLLCEVAMANPKSVSKKVLDSVANRLRDHKEKVRAMALEKLTELYAAFCSNSSVTFAAESPDWIPAKILRAAASRVHRLQAVDILMEQLFPADLPLEERAKRWIAIFYHSDKTDLRVLERKLLLHKQRFQTEMKAYLHLRQKSKEEESNSEITKKIQNCFTAISLTFPETSKHKEQLEKLDQMKDPLVFKRLQTLLNPATSYAEARSTCDELLSGLGKHPQSEFLKTVALRCSYVLFGREHVVSVLKTVKALKSTNNKEAISAGMSVLVEFSGYFPELMEGVEEEIVSLLNEGEDDNVKEKALFILAKSGSFLRDRLSDSRSSLDLMLETYCLDGTRKQAKNAVNAIAALSTDSGLKALSVLYGHLLTQLKSNGHRLPTLLQSLGCIAQIATSVYETREKDVVGFVLEDLLLREPAESTSKPDWDSRSEDCSLKIYGVKALVKSFLPFKDAHSRQGSLKNFLPVLLKLLKSGSVKETTSASDVDKAHLRLTAAKAVLRLSTKLDKELSVELFRHAVFTVQDPFVQVRKEFLSKAYQYLKPQHLAPKYATVYPLCATDTVKEIVEDSKRFMTDFAITRREIATELQTQPEYMLTYLVHLLAHHAKFPDVSSEAAAYEPFYRILFAYLHALLQSPDPKKEVGNVPAIFKILRTIKSTEDVEDAAKTQNIYVVCDIGLHIAKELAGKRSTEGYKSPVRLPVSFYSDIPEAQAKEDGSELPPVLTDAVLGGFYSALTDTSAPSAQRKRMKKAEDTSADEGDDDDPPPKKSRKAESTSKIKGRKGNTREAEEGATNMSEDEMEDASQKRKRGRPSKEKEKQDTVSEDAAPRKRGRPKGSAAKKQKVEAESSGDDKVDTPKVKQEQNQKTRSGDSAKKSEKQELADAASTAKRKKSEKTPVKEETEDEDDNDYVPDPLPGRRVKVWWPKDKRFYAGRVQSYNSKTKKHRIGYDDGDKETLLMKKERWEYIEETSPSPPRDGSRSKKKPSVVVRERDDEAQGSVQKKSSVKKRERTKEASDDAQHHSENHAGRPYSKGSKVNVNGGEAESSQSKGTDTDDDEPLESYRSRMKKKTSSSSKE